MRRTAWGNVWGGVNPGFRAQKKRAPPGAIVGRPLRGLVRLRVRSYTVTGGLADSGPFQKKERTGQNSWSGRRPVE